MKLQAVVFDMDGLMFDTERIVQYSWDVAGERLGYEKLGQNIYHTLGMNRAGRQVYFQKKYGMDFPFDTFRAYNREVFFARVQKEGLPVKPGLYTLLDFLKNLHIPMAVATSSGGDYARDNLEQAGITRCFSAVVTGDMVSHAKPDPEIYLEACRKLQTAPSAAMAFEDSPNGIRSAKAAGMTAVMVPDLIAPDEEIRALADHCLSSLEHAPELIRRKYL